MAGNAARRRKLTKQLEHSLLVLSDVGKILRVSTFKIPRSAYGRSGRQGTAVGRSLAKNCAFATGGLHPASLLQGKGRRGAGNVCGFGPDARRSEAAHSGFVGGNAYLLSYPRP